MQLEQQAEALAQARQSQTHDAIEEESSRHVSPQVAAGSSKRRSRVERGANAEVRSSMEGWSKEKNAVNKF